jgi:hypothetical protein
MKFDDEIVFFVKGQFFLLTHIENGCPTFKLKCWTDHRYLWYFPLVAAGLPLLVDPLELQLLYLRDRK